MKTLVTTPSPQPWNGDVESPGVWSAGFLARTQRHGRPFWIRALARVRAALGTHVPLGYQDEDGFHYGKPPRSANIRST